MFECTSHVYVFVQSSVRLYWLMKCVFLVEQASRTSRSRKMWYIYIWTQPGFKTSYFHIRSQDKEIDFMKTSYSFRSEVVNSYVIKHNFSCLVGLFVSRSCTHCTHGTRKWTKQWFVVCSRCNIPSTSTASENYSFTSSPRCCSSEGWRVSWHVRDSGL